jgi:hypothetical protein
MSQLAMIESMGKISLSFVYMEKANIISRTSPRATDKECDTCCLVHSLWVFPKLKVSPVSELCSLPRVNGEYDPSQPPDFAGGCGFSQVRG